MRQFDQVYQATITDLCTAETEVFDSWQSCQRGQILVVNVFVLEVDSHQVTLSVPLKGGSRFFELFLTGITTADTCQK